MTLALGCAIGAVILILTGHPIYAGLLGLLACAVERQGERR